MWHACRSLLVVLVIALAGGLAHGGTIVRLETSLGNVDIALFDDANPATVANFLGYVTDGDYTDSIFHRSISEFVVQGGGFYNDFSPVATDPPVVNEFNQSNLRGTVAMAKQGGNPDSATNQWFFNLANNSGNLDNQNGGFTVFGRVINGGMSVVDQMAAVPTFNGGGAFTDIPLRNFTDQDLADGVTPDDDNFVMIQAASVIGQYAPIWQNAAENFDATNDGFVGPLDALVIVNRVTEFGDTSVADVPFVGPLFFDADGNDYINTFDAQSVIEKLGSGSSVSAGGVFASAMGGSVSAAGTIVPEPSTMMLAGLGALLLGVVAARSRRRR